MEHLVEDGRDVILDNDDIKDAESSEKFEMVIHELFEQNGILNDLRAYLRGHIVNVLKNAETGNPPNCQKHFKQRLELTYQALNIIIAEYLLRLEFSYSLSVFVSEIPLSNMVFEFAKTILKSKDLNVTDARFGESDVWSVLNYLGIQCDSEHASKIAYMYNESRESPLLYCILKCITLNDKVPIYAEPVNTSDESILSDKTFETDDERIIKSSHRSILNKCKHYSFCKTCQNRKKQLKIKYEKKINKLEKMFDQLKTVYEAEVEMIKEDGQKKIKHSIASHALLLQQHREQLEASYKEKEDKLEENIRQKKKFLWGLARALRDQHECMTKAMMEVKFETEKLVEKENDLKNQLQEAEIILKSKGEKMYNQISQEIKILGAHFESMKKERDNLDKERNDLDNLKQINDNNNKVLEEYKYNKEELKLHYDLLKDELDVLKKYIKDSKQSKCLVEKGNVMEEKSLMNNEVNVRINDDNDDRFDDKLKYQVVNHFKKKNINFNQLNQEVNRPSSSGADVREECNCSVTIHMLKEENERLKKMSLQQIEHIDALSNERNALQQQVTRIRTSPVIQHGFIGNRINQNRNIQSNQHAAGELYAFPNLQSRVLFPSEAVPFLGVIADKRDERRNLLNQWRALRRPRPMSSPPLKIANPGQSIQSDPVCSLEKNVPDTTENANIQPSSSDTPPVNCKVKNMKPVSHEAKRKQQNNIKEHTIRREKSPNSALHEAKLRLRKLEIEAEAVEKSYLEFRKRQSELKNVQNNVNLPEESVLREPIRLDKPVHSKTLLKIKQNSKIDDTNFKESPELLKKDFDKYLREYQTKYDIGKWHFPSKNLTLQKVEPIPPTISTKFHEIESINYVETPITEFRKLYQKDSNVTVNHTLTDTVERLKDNNETIIEDNNKIKCDDQADLQIPTKHIDNDNNFDKELCEKDISFQNIIKDTSNCCNKSNLEAIDIDTGLIDDNIENIARNEDHDVIVSISNENLDGIIEKTTENMQIQEFNEVNDINSKSDNNMVQNEENLLIVEVENIYNESNIKMSESKDLLLVVESSVINENSEQNKENVLSTQMTIIVSPKNIENNEPKKHLSETVKKITENDILNDIFQAKNKEEVSSVELSKKLENSSKMENSDEYGDFSADVDNYNSQYEFGNNSPISVAKTSEADDDFWES